MAICVCVCVYVCVCVCIHIIYYPNSLFAALLLHILLYLEQKIWPEKYMVMLFRWFDKPMFCFWAS